ncbi:Acetyltransferase (GNAT) family protein [Loktanella fryxellensis]|uniref:Acetyltransferase (GNAT) family protein n=1 Tax=Loktanella fryxellensis TaxID=245187 RepID=A0A1H8FKL1_9RHOB|nr:GNAT family N-acetyltransferase [Loktanella fryxellensis]SEN31628.1 Acetyltransferase (GNAT) family protein [Loktanella fryxellensis]
MTVRIAIGLTEAQRAAAAALYWEAFGAKLGPVLGPSARALDFVAAAIDPSHVIAATDAQDRLVGVIGFKTHRSAFVAGCLPVMAASYGWPGALWRTGLLNLLARDTETTCLLTDGLAVAAHARGQGIGTALIAALAAEAHRRHYPALRLDVIDTNPRAQALYARLGFRAVKTTPIGPLRHIFGYRHTITMTRPT